MSVPLVVPELVRQRAMSNGHAGRRWLDDLPAVVAGLADRWGLDVGHSFRGGTDPRHHLVVPAADIVAGVSKTYSIQGTETHDHKVTLGPAALAKLATDTLVVVTSTRTAGHSHPFFVVCA